MEKFFGSCQDYEEWWNVFKNTLIDRFAKGVDFLLRNHQYKSFPLIIDMDKAITNTRPIQNYIPDDNTQYASKEDFAKLNKVIKNLKIK